MGTIKARLQGHEFDLESLARLFSAGDPLVGRDDQGFYLAAVQLDGLIDEGGELMRTANEVLQRVNGVGRAYEDGFRPVSLSGTFADGDSRHHVVVADTIEVRAKVHVADVVVDGSRASTRAPSATLGPQVLTAAGKDKDVADALALLGAPAGVLGWVDLWKVFEVVRASAGGATALVAKGLASKPEIGAFGASANLPSVSGKGARHARMEGQPTATMSLAEGREFDRRLVRTWSTSASVVQSRWGHRGRLAS